ncbi:SRPBCC family protein [Mesonia sp. K7]|uniref:SRPBCC family protein n=1 Tax=Mesonia sp. K7 TaxID=2218606 RepID=UPI000DA8394B|nr:SRPBCC family protein [Mesonia sp. K7]PZD78315.1 SRPBCC family protein [Mesonia sp. K7]
MHLESNTTTVNKSQEELFNFLSDVKNFETIMPDSIQRFELLDENSFLFQLKGMPEIGLQIKDKTPHSQIVLGAKSDKFPFTLKADLTPISENQTEAQLIFDGEFNAMMAMMVKSPLKNFINTLAEKIGQL